MRTHATLESDTPRVRELKIHAAIKPQKTIKYASARPHEKLQGLDIQTKIDFQQQNGNPMMRGSIPYNPCIALKKKSLY